MVYIDGNHRYASTMQYFELLLSKVNEQSILIFDDIYWSSEMEKAWNEIKNHEAVTLTIDLFYVGIVFLEKKINKSNILQFDINLKYNKLVTYTIFRFIGGLARV